MFSDIELKNYKKLEDDEVTIEDQDEPLSPDKKSCLEQELKLQEEEHDWSTSVVPETDDPLQPTFTLRVVILGILWATFLAISNTIFSFRKNPFGIPTTIVVLLAYPMGLFMELLPNFKIFGFDLNPGKFSVKEHVLIVMIASAAGHRPYGVDNVVGQAAEQFLNDKRVNFFNSICWVLSTQMIGLGLAGICRRFLVKPATMLWPSCLPDVALYTSFHKTHTLGDTEKYKMSRYTFFWIIFGGAFVYQWLPGYFMTCLKLVSILCFFGSSKILRFLGSGDAFEGTGILGLSFDWSVIAMTGPLLSPFWASANFFAQAIFWGWIVIPLVHFLNPFHTPELEGQYPYGRDGDRFPSVNSNRIYDRFGKVAPPVQFVTFPDLKLNETMYENRGPFYLASSFSINYLCSFMNIAAVFSHVVLWYGSSIWRQAKQAFTHVKKDHFTDIHNRLMQSYRDIPDWIYLSWFFLFLIIQLLVCSLTPFKMPIWATLFAVFLGGSLTIPIGIIQAVTGSQMGLNVLTEFIIGFMLPGETVAVMTFKSLGYNVMIQALDLTKHLKIAHYMHISPIAMVAAQLLGSILGAFLNTGAVFWVLRVFKDELADVAGEWSATGYRTFAAAGSVWGAIGPARFFGIGSPYSTLLLGFPIGLVLPLIPWLLNKWKPSPYWRLIHFPLLTQGVPSGTNQAIIVIPFIIAFIFNFIIFRYKRDWWKKYNFILSCGLDSGVAISTLVITFWRQVGSSGEFHWALRPSTNVDYYCRDVGYDGL